jgi:hypothetical protein
VESVLFCFQASVILLFYFSLNVYFTFKNMKINLDMANNVTYKHAKFYYKILYIVGSTKISKYDKICRFKNIHT